MSPFASSAEREHTIEVVGQISVAFLEFRVLEGVTSEPVVLCRSGAVFFDDPHIFLC